MNRPRTTTGAIAKPWSYTVRDLPLRNYAGETYQHCDVEIEVDWHVLAKRLGAKALLTKTNMTRFAAGAIRARVKVKTQEDV